MRGKKKRSKRETRYEEEPNSKPEYLGARDTHTRGQTTRNGKEGKRGAERTQETIDQPLF